MKMNNIELHQGNCLEIMDELIKKGVKVDAIITDPPYGTTACKWDSIISFDEMWKRLKLLRKDNTPIVLFGSEPFSSLLRISNLKEYKYDWIWDKKLPTNFLNAKKQPLRKYEIISVFYKKQCLYNPQMEKRNKVRVNKSNGNVYHGDNKKVYGSFKSVDSVLPYKYPTNILVISNANKTNIVHPTQKPVKLMEYLVKTYTNENDLVLDFTAGSFTTAIACLNTKRRFIGIELDKEYFKIGKKRVEKHLEMLQSP